MTIGMTVALWTGALAILIAWRPWYTDAVRAQRDRQRPPEWPHRY